MKETLEIKTDEAWKTALTSWNSPYVPYVIAPRTIEEINLLGEVGSALQNELAFMKYPEFQTYLNIEKIIKTFPKNPVKGVQTISKHELGHRFCPYDTITSIVLKHFAKKELEGEELPYNPESASNLILNLFTDMCINTTLMKRGDKDILWAYQQLSKDKKDSKLWRVYGKSMELTWKKPLLPEDTELNDEESEAAQELAALFKRDFFDRSKWPDNIKTYARIISQFLEDEQKDGKAALDNAAGNIPQEIDEKTAQELARRLAEIGSDGLPTNPSGLKEFKEIMAGFGQGDPLKASITFYDLLSDSYNVRFATRPFGRPRVNPFQPVKWAPSMGAEKLDINYSAQVGGKIIPGVNTYTWKTRKRETSGGLEEIVPDLDLYLDSSGSTPNPLEEISLLVLAGFVVAKKAHRKGASIRATVFSGKGQSETREATRDLYAVFEKLVIYYNGGTYFPTEKLLENQKPKQALIITDTYLFNEQETAEAIIKYKQKNPNNKVTVYGIDSGNHGEDLQKAGAEVIRGTTTDIFKRAIGKADEVYVK